MGISSVYRVMEGLKDMYVGLCGLFLCDGNMTVHMHLAISMQGEINLNYIHRCSKYKVDYSYTYNRLCANESSSIFHVNG